MASIFAKLIEASRVTLNFSFRLVHGGRETYGESEKYLHKNLMK